MAPIRGRDHDQATIFGRKGTVYVTRTLLVHSMLDYGHAVRERDQTVIMIIKGNVLEALDAVASHGIVVNKEDARGFRSDGKTAGVERAEALIFCDDSVETHLKLGAWFAEDMARVAPYPNGSLLYFGKGERTAT